MANNLLERQVEKERQTEETVIPQATVPDDDDIGILFLMSDDTETSFDVKENQGEEKCGADDKAEEDDGRMEENDNQGNDSLDFPAGNTSKGNSTKKICIDFEAIRGNPASHDYLRRFLNAGLQIIIYADNSAGISMPDGRALR